MKEIGCPFCGSKRAVQVAKYDTQALTENYRKHLGVDVARFYKSEELQTLLCVECQLRFHAPGLPGDSAFYDTLQQQEYYYETDKPEFSYVIAKICEIRPGSILEIGCGAGHLLKKLVGAYDVAGVEYSEKAIASLSRANIPLDTGRKNYDLVVCLQVLEHVPEPRKFLQEAIAKLGDRGFLLITVPNVESEYIREVMPLLDLPPHHLTQWSKTALSNIATQLDLEIRDYYEEPIRPQHLLSLIQSRRSRLLANRFRDRLRTIVARLFDPVLVPYFLNFVRYGGHTHGMLYQKR